MLPRVIQHLGTDSNTVFFREDAKVILKGSASADDIEEAVEEQNKEQYAWPSGEDQGYEYDAEAGEDDAEDGDSEAEEDEDF